MRSELDVPLDELWEPPDPSVPRGWSGVFEVEPLGAEGAFPLSGHGIDEDRELFRTGRQVAAELIRSKDGRWLERPKAFPRTLTLRVEDREIDVETWTPRAIWPELGARMTVALSDDGSRVALDTDERWDGLPGRALIFTAAPIDETADPFLATLEKARASGTMSEKQFAKAKANYQRSLDESEIGFARRPTS